MIFQLLEIDLYIYINIHKIYIDTCAHFILFDSLLSYRVTQPLDGSKMYHVRCVLLSAR